MLTMYMQYRKNVEKKPPEPKRIIFYRGMFRFETEVGNERADGYADGVSEGQFRQVLEIELPRLKGMCSDVPVLDRTCSPFSQRHARN